MIRSNLNTDVLAQFSLAVLKSDKVKSGTTKQKLYMQTTRHTYKVQDPGSNYLPLKCVHNHSPAGM